MAPGLAERSGAAGAGTAGEPPHELEPLSAIQLGLESLYRVETRLNIRDFLLTQEQRAALAPDRCPGEQLLLREHEEGVDLALYLEAEALHTLREHDPRRGVSERNLRQLLLVLEGVSHFIYAVDRARSQRTVSALELELQAEVDKYVTLVLLTWDVGPDLIDLLFHRVVYHEDLSAEERERYMAANAWAARYARRLSDRYVKRRSLGALLTEVRRFWRLSCAGKLSHIINQP